MQYLAGQIGDFHNVVINQPERTDSGRGQVSGCGRTQPAGPDHKHLGPADFLLPLGAEIRQADMPAELFVPLQWVLTVTAVFAVIHS